MATQNITPEIMVVVDPRKVAIDNSNLYVVRYESVREPRKGGKYSAQSTYRVGLWVIAQYDDTTLGPQYTRAVIMRVHQDSLYVAVDWHGLGSEVPVLTRESNRPRTEV